MRERARTVIVGGGPAASALAAALAVGGDPDVLVLDPRAERADRDVPTERFGAVLQAAHTVREVCLSRDAIATFADLARDAEAAWRTVGSLEVATTDERLAALRRRAALLADAGVDAEVLDPRGAAAVLPSLDAGAILGALHVPGDGVADRAAVGAALARRASAAGASSAPGVRVTGVRIEDGRVTGVETDAGPVACERLVLASCTASVRIAGLVGIALPIVSVIRPIGVTDAASGPPADDAAMPVVRHPDAALAIRRRGSGFAVAGHGDPAAWVEAATRLLPSQADAFRTMSVASAASDAARVTVTPDGLPIVGAHAGLEGLWILAGARLAHLPPLAEALAARLLGAEPAHDIGPADPNRWYPFEAAPEVAGQRATALAGAAHAVTPLVPDDLPPRGLRRSPIARRAEDLRAVTSGLAGWEVPRWYASNGGDRDAAVAAELRAAREAVAIADVTPLAKFDLEGDGVLDALRRALPALVDLPVGVLVGVGPPAGSAVADLGELVLVRKDEALARVVVDARVGPRVLGWFRGIARATGAPDRGRAFRVTERTGSLFAIALVGPGAEQVLAATGADAPVDAGAFPPGTARYLGLGAVTPVWAHRSPVGPVGAVGAAGPAGPVGRPGPEVPTWTLFGQVAMGEFAWDLLTEAGRGAGIVPIGAEALAALGAG